MSALSSEPLRGVIPPVLTPLLARDRLDVAALEQILERMFAAGVTGLFLLGTTGEGPSLGYRLRRELIAEACRITAGRVPILVGITDPAFVESVAIARAAAECGAAGVVVAPPYYLSPSQEELAEYLRQLATAVPLPLLLYNFPALTKIPISLETVRRLLDVDQIRGIKDSSGDLPYFRELLPLARQRPDWTVLMGPEDKMAEAVLMNADGGITGGANLCPQLYVDLYRAAVARDLPRVAALQTQVERIVALIYTVHPAGGGGVVKGLKAALASLGIGRDVPADPFVPSTPAERALLESRLAELGITI